MASKVHERWQYQEAWMAWRKLAWWFAAGFLAIGFLAAGRSFIGSGSFLRWTVNHNRPRLVKLALRYGAQVDAPDGRGHTPLMLAAEDGNTPMVRLLLEAGANVNALDNLGYQSLHWAATNRQWDGSTVKLLLEHGADPLARSRRDITPLTMAVDLMDGG